MRAKMVINAVEKHENADGDVSCETLRLNAVGKSESYGKDGEDENNTFARFTPSASLQLQIANPQLLDSFKVGQTFYVDFTEVT